MSHHSREHDPQMAEELMKRYKEATKKADGALQDALADRLGPTGRFPEGRLTKHDEGEIAFALGRKEGKVIIDFGSPVHWLGMNPNQAIDLGNALIRHARKARRQ